MTDALRLFVAAETGEALATAVSRARAVARARAPGASWARPEAAHLTLAFLGDVSAARVPGIASALTAAARGCRPCTLRIAGAEVFGRPSSPRVLWLGFDGDTGALGALQQAVAGALAALGFPPEARPFFPHLTLARARGARGDRDLAAARDALADFDGGAVEVTGITLMQSELGRDGARHTPLARVAVGLG